MPSTYILFNASFHLQPPAVQRPRSRMDSLIFMTETIKSSKSEEAIASTRDSILLSHSESKETEKQLITQETDAEPIAADVQRPVDLYKVHMFLFFSMKFSFLRYRHIYHGRFISIHISIPLQNLNIYICL